MKLFNDFQSYQLNFSGCYLDYFKLIIIHFNHFMQLRETLITVQNQTAHCQIIIRFRQVEPESLIYLFYFQTGRKHIFTFTQLLTYIGRIIMLILNIAENFFHQILQRDDTRRTTEFVHHYSNRFFSVA